MLALVVFRFRSFSRAFRATYAMESDQLEFHDVSKDLSLPLFASCLRIWSISASIAPRILLIVELI